jgi:hypothetical protein
MRKGSATAGALGGLALVLAGIAGYFVVLLCVPSAPASLRTQALPNWALVAAGIGFSFAAFRRATAGRRRVAAALLATNVVLAVLFAGFLHRFLAVPAAGGPVVGSRVPDVALRDQTGRTVRLAGFRGDPLLLVFYRGHW